MGIEGPYLPITYHVQKFSGVAVRSTPLWENFLFETGKNGVVSTTEKLKEYNGTLINDVIVFKTEADKTWFILKWS